MSDPVLSARPILERFRLDGRVALITGGGQGIGRGFAHALGEAGAAVTVDDILPDKAEEVVEELRAKGIDAIAIEADVRDNTQVHTMVDTVLQKWGKLTIGVNCAGVGNWTAAEEVDEANWDAINATNLRGLFFSAQAEGRVMLEAGYGKIINVASISGSIVNTPQNQAVYNITKAGVMHLTKSLATEWAERGVRVNSISPGYTRTKLVEDLLATPVGQTVLPEWLARVPQRKMAEVTDLQGLVVYLASAVSDYVTGADIIIDGGYCAW